MVKNPLTLETLAFRLKMGDYYRNKECLLSDITLMVRDVTPVLSLSSVLFSFPRYSTLLSFALHTSSLSLLPSHLLNAAVMCLFQLA